MSVSGFSTLSKISQLIPTYLPPAPELVPILSEKYFFVTLRTFRSGLVETPTPEGRWHFVIILIVI